MPIQEACDETQAMMVVCDDGDVIVVMKGLTGG